MLALKRLVTFCALLLACAWAYGFQFNIGNGSNQGSMAPEVHKKAPSVRSVTGIVLDQGDNPVPHAIVYLKNTKTLAIKTSITNDSGSYQFTGLVPDQDYELSAGLNGSKSPTKTLSGFDSREKTTLNLHLDQKDQKDQKPKEAKEADESKPKAEDSKPKPESK